MTSPISVSAPAKINLYLAVSELRDDGYHDVSTVLQSLEFGDELSVTAADRFSFVSDPAFDIPECENLVARAAHALASLLDIEPAFAFRLTKRIPMGAGLGGGSSDAAAALAGMAALLGLAPDDPRLLVAAAGVGTDVPFFLAGGTALYGGRGEELVRRLPTLTADVVLIKPAASISTAVAYAAFDRITREPAPGPRHLIDALRCRDLTALSSTLYNNMTTPATTLVAELQDTLAWVDACEGVTGSLLCGSGSAVFALCRDGECAARVAERARARGLWSVPTKTCPDGVRVRTEEGA